MTHTLHLLGAVEQSLDHLQAALKDFQKSARCGILRAKIEAWYAAPLNSARSSDAIIFPRQDGSAHCILQQEANKRRVTLAILKARRALSALVRAMAQHPAVMSQGVKPSLALDISARDIKIFCPFFDRSRGQFVHVLDYSSGVLARVCGALDLAEGIGSGSTWIVRPLNPDVRELTVTMRASHAQAAIAWACATAYPRLLIDGADGVCAYKSVDNVSEILQQVRDSLPKASPT